MSARNLEIRKALLKDGFIAFVGDIVMSGSLAVRITDFIECTAVNACDVYSIEDRCFGARVKVDILDRKGETWTTCPNDMYRIIDEEEALVLPL